jgi:predicted metal-dependent HD superfamily phosphohydrolase
MNSPGLYSIQPILDHWNIEMSETEILARWQEPHRKYHTLTHLSDLYNQIQKLSNSTDISLTNIEKDMLYLTSAFHDIIYDPKHSDNEERSTKLFLDVSKKSPYPERIQEIAEIICDTKTHQPRTPLSKQFSEMDMSIVLAPFSELEVWEEGIRYEYQHIPSLLYKIGRGRFLKKMIKQYPENAEALTKLYKKIVPFYFRYII